MDTETTMTLTPAHSESAQDSIASVEEFSSIMDSTFKNLKSRFDKSSGDILSKMEELAARMDDMEKTMTELVASQTDSDMGTSPSA